MPDTDQSAFNGGGELGEVFPPLSPIQVAQSQPNNSAPSPLPWPSPDQLALLQQGFSQNNPPQKDQSQVPAQGAIPGQPNGAPPVSVFSNQGALTEGLTTDEQQRDAQLKLRQVYGDKTTNDALQQKQLQQRQERYNAELDRMREREGAYAAEIQPWNEQTMAPKKTTLWEKFGSPGFVLSMFASAFTAMPMNSAMQAGGAAMNAINEGDFEARKEAMDVWNKNTNLALKRLEEQHKEYSEILQQQGHDLEATRLNMTLAAAKYGDDITKAYADAGMFPELDKVNQTRAEAAKNLAQAHQAIMEQEVISDALNGHPAQPGEPVTHQDAKGHPMAGGDANWYTGKDPTKAYADVLSKIEMAKRAGLRSAGGLGGNSPNAALWHSALDATKDDQHPNGDPVKAAQIYSDWQGDMKANQQNKLGKGPEAVKAIGDGILEGKNPPEMTRLYGMAGPVQAYLSDHGYSLAKAQLDWEAAKKQVLSLNGPQMVRYIGLAKSAVNTIDEVKRLSNQLKLDHIPAYNHVQLLTYIQAHASGKEHNDAVAYLGAVNTLKEEFANLANGGYAPTEPAWALANQQINGDYDVGALATSLNEVQRLINFRLTAIPGLRTLGPGAPNPYMPAEPQEQQPQQFPNSSDPFGILQ